MEIRPPTEYGCRPRQELVSIQEAEAALSQFYIKKQYRGYPYLIEAVKRAANAFPDRLTLEELCARMAEGGSVPTKTVSQDLRRIAKSIWDRSANFTVYERITGYKALTPPLPLEFIYSMAEHLHSAKNHTIGAKHMLQFVDGRFHAHGVSFTMPDGFYLHDEMFHPFALCCLSPNQRVYITVEIAPDGREVLSALQALFEEDPSLHPTSVVQPITVNETRGYDVLYDCDNISYYQARLRFARGQIVTCIAQCEQGSQGNLKKNPSVQALLQTIRAE